MVLKIIDSQYEGKSSYLFLIIVGLFMLPFIGMLGEYRIIGLFVSMFLIAVFVLLNFRKKKYLPIGQIAFSANAIKIKRSEESVVKEFFFSELAQMVFYYGGYDGYTKLRTPELGDKNYFYIEFANGKKELVNVYIPNKKTYQWLKSYIEKAELKASVEKTPIQSSSLYSLLSDTSN
ncbi:MAG: hypothetical protein IPO21_00320 [Bacteroidales bacterium]|nr:hypothetical protein [Bacteroidales bacterium]